MATYNISLNPVQLEQLSVVEAGDLTLSLVRHFVDHIRSMDFAQKEKEQKLLGTFKTHVEWYMGFIIRVLTDIDKLDPDLSLLRIVINSMDSPQATEIKESIYNEQNPFAKMPLHQAWHVISKLLRGWCDFVTDQSKISKFSRAIENMCIVVEEKIKQIECLIISTLALTQVNEKEINFYSIVVEINSELMAGLLKTIE